MNVRKLLTLLLLLVSLSCSKDEHAPIDVEQPKTEHIKEVWMRQPLKGETISLDLVVQVLPKSKGKQGELRSLANSANVKSSYPISDEGKVLLYIINYKPSGYAIVSALRSHQPLLAHSDRGEIDPTNLPPALSALIDGFKKSVLNSVHLPDSIKRQNAIAWESLGLNQQKLRSFYYSGTHEEYIREQLSKLQEEGYSIYDYSYLTSGQDYVPNYIIENLFSGRAAGVGRSDVYLIVRDVSHQTHWKAPLLKTTWGQGYGYNKYVPNYYPVGCVAVAVGQIMKYHEFPKSYAWAEMLVDRFTDATAKFLYEVALGVNMDFQEDGSGAFTKDAHRFLSDIGYTSNLVKYDAWEVVRSIERNRPVYIDGVNSRNSGHAFIADGCEAYTYYTEAKIIWITETEAFDATPAYYQVLYDGRVRESKYLFAS